MRFLTLAIGALLLSACTTVRYTPVRCLTPDQLEEIRKAEPPKVGDKLTGKADEDVRVVAGSAIRLRAWGRGMLGVLEGCAG